MSKCRIKAMLSGRTEKKKKKNKNKKLKKIYKKKS